MFTLIGFHELLQIANALHRYISTTPQAIIYHIKSTCLFLSIPHSARESWRQYCSHSGKIAGKKIQNWYLYIIEITSNIHRNKKKPRGSNRWRIWTSIISYYHYFQTFSPHHLVSHFIPFSRLPGNFEETLGNRFICANALQCNVLMLFVAKLLNTWSSTKTFRSSIPHNKSIHRNRALP